METQNKVGSGVCWDSVSFWLVFFFNSLDENSTSTQHTCAGDKLGKWDASENI